MDWFLYDNGPRHERVNFFASLWTCFVSHITGWKLLAYEISESAGWSAKNIFCKISQNSLENTCLVFLFWLKLHFLLLYEVNESMVGDFLRLLENFTGNLFTEILPKTFFVWDFKAIEVAEEHLRRFQ